MRRPPGYYLKLWESGELVRLAAQSSDYRDLARRLGVSADALFSGLLGLRDTGHDVPSPGALCDWARRLGAIATNPGDIDKDLGDAVGDDWEIEKTSPDLAPVIEASMPASDWKLNRENMAGKVPHVAHGHEATVNLRELPGMFPYGTPMQRASADAVIRCGSVAAAAADLQLTTEQLRAHLSELERRAAARGWAPGNDMTKAAPAGYSVKGVSTLYGADGEVRGQWVKTKRDEEQRLQDLLDAVQRIAEPFRGVSEPVVPPGATDTDLLCVYPFGDPHFGLYAWAQESGDDFDLDIAERVTVGAIDHLVRVAPSARSALILSVGDTFHADSYENRTARGGHALDVDTRWPKVLSVGIRAYRRCIDRALEKHEDVTFWSVPGNHDPHSAVMLAVCLAQYYEREPRVAIDTSPGKFRWHRFGDVLLGATHGESVKPHQMAAVMACDRAKDWGETKHRRIYSGHLHHDRTQEFPGVTVDTLRTLAAKDAWHAEHGYRSGRDMKCDVYHREHGLISRHVVDAGRLLPRKEAA